MRLAPGLGLVAAGCHGSALARGPWVSAGRGRQPGCARRWCDEASWLPLYRSPCEKRRYALLGRRAGQTCAGPPAWSCQLRVPLGHRRGAKVLWSHGGTLLRTRTWESCLTGTARSAKAPRPSSGSPIAKPSCCRCRIITSCSRCRLGSPTSRTRTRPSSTTCCSRSRPRPC